MQDSKRLHQKSQNTASISFAFTFLDVSLGTLGEKHFLADERKAKLCGPKNILLFFLKIPAKKIVWIFQQQNRKRMYRLAQLATKVCLQKTGVIVL